MATPSPISVWVRVAGVWKRVDPPHVRVGGSWKLVKGVWVKVSGVWKRCFADIDGEIELTDSNVTAFDVGAPFNSSAGLRWNGDGTIDVMDKPPNANWLDNVAHWRLFDVGREYEIKFEYVSGDHLDTEPTLDTWLNLTDPDTTWTLLTNRTLIGIEQGTYDVRAREKITAPPAGNDTSRHTIKIDNEGTS